MSTHVLIPQTNVEKSHDLITAQEAADYLRVSTDTVIRWFGNLPGVIDLGSPEVVRQRKRRYRILRIPRSVFEKFIQENRIA